MLPETNVTDRLSRTLGNLRLSVTDRCNLRCSYCMPEEDYVWLPRSDILTFEETGRLVDVFLSCGVDKVRITGGEPLLRQDLPVLVRLLAAKPALKDLALTTNGLLLAALAPELRAAGLHRVTVSLDTLRADRFIELTRRKSHADVLAGIEAVARLDWPRLKLDGVVMRGVNDDELADLLEYARSVRAEMRFIEYMDVGGATKWSFDKVVSRVEILARLTARYGPIAALPGQGSAPAERFRLPDGSTFGIIASTTAPFCRACDRSRLTADGQWLLCLYAATGHDLRRVLRSGVPDGEIAGLIRSVWSGRTDRGAEARLELADRAPLAGAAELRDKPHLEMHTRGG